MSKTNLNKMTVREILAQVGSFVKAQQLEDIVKHRGAFLELIRESNIEIETIDVNDFFIKNANEINKEKLIYFTALNLQAFMEYIQVQSKGNMTSIGKLELEKSQKYYNKCEELLKDAKFEIPILKKENGIIEIKEIKTSDELMNNKKRDDDGLKQKNLNRLKEIEEDIDLEGFLSIGSLDDYEEFIAAYKHNGPDFKFVILNNLERKIEEYLDENITDNKIPSKEEVNKFKISTVIDESCKIIRKFPEKIDIDKFLLLSAYRAKNLMEKNDSKEESYFLTKIMQVAYQHIENKKCKINGEIQINVNEEVKTVDYSVRKLEQDMSQIADEVYFSNYKISEIKKALLNGELQIGKDTSKEVLKLLKFNNREKKELINLNSENFEYLVMLDALSADEIKDILKENIEGIKIDTLFTDSMYSNGIIDKEDIMNLYMKNNINFSSFINLDKMFDLKEHVTVEDLVKYYFKMKENNENGRDFDRYSMIFKEIKLKDKEPEEIEYIANQIMEELYKQDSEYEEDLKTLYKENLFPIKSLIEWNGDEMIYDLIRNNTLKPKDAKELFMEGRLDLKKAYQTLKNSSLSDAEKMNFIISSFDGNGANDKEIEMQNEARMYLMQSLNISKQFSEFESNSNSRKPRNIKNHGSKGNQYVSDPVYRWQLISTIDPDYTTQVYSDGVVKFLLPNIKNGTVILEKLYRRTKDGIVINYGDATYVMSEEEFINNKHDIEIESKINKRNLTAITKESKEANKIVHTKNWGNFIKENLDISPENGYDEEKIKKIDQLTKQIEESRELI